MRFSSVAAAAVSLLLACGDSAVLVTVEGDLSVPIELDGLCLSVFDSDPGGAGFTRFYQLEGELAQLPQSLAVEPGAASSAFTIARGYRDGIEVSRDRAELRFSDDPTLALDRCRAGTSGSAAERARFSAAAGTRVAVSLGREGSVVVAVGPGLALALTASGSALSEIPGATPAAPSMAPALLVAFDADGDCDDDLVLVGSGVPVLWRRDPGPVFVEQADAFSGVGAAATAASADVDGDGDIDLIVGGGSALTLLRNDGSGRFQPDGAAISPVASDVTAIVLGDLDADGAVDIVVGQGSTNPGPSLALFNDANGSGFFDLADAALPSIALQTRAMALADVTGNGFLDVLLVTANAQPRLYVNRGDGRLEDRSFVTLPSLNPIDAAAVVVGDWDGDCLSDAVVGVAGAGAPVAWRGSDAGTLVVDDVSDASGDSVVLADVDDDGQLDLITAGGPSGIVWVSR